MPTTLLHQAHLTTSHQWQPHSGGCSCAWQVSAALEALLRKALLRPLPEVADESKAEAPAPAVAAVAAEADQVCPLHCCSPTAQGL